MVLDDTQNRILNCDDELIPFITTVLGSGSYVNWSQINNYISFSYLKKKNHTIHAYIFVGISIPLNYFKSLIICFKKSYRTMV